MSKYFSRPEFLNIFEGLIAGEIVDHDNAVCPFIVGAGNRTEPFLASSIPNLQFDFAPIDGERSAWSEYYLKRKSTPMVAR